MNSETFIDKFESQLSARICYPGKTILRVPKQKNGYTEYEVLDLLNAGPHNIIYKVADPETGNPLVVKILTESDGLGSGEGLILTQLDHPNIIKLISHSRRNGKHYLILEYVDGGDLYKYVYNKKRLSEKEAKTIFRQIVDALIYAYSKSICHRDVKAENVLLTTDGRAILADWEFGTPFINNYPRKHNCGSRYHSSPEIWTNKMYVGPEADAWALGVTLYSMVSGFYPFSGETTSSTISEVINGEYDIFEDWSVSLVDLIDGLLEADMSKRLTLYEIRDHPWLNCMETLSLSDYLDGLASLEFSQNSQNSQDSRDGRTSIEDSENRSYLSTDTSTEDRSSNSSFSQIPNHLDLKISLPFDLLPPVRGIDLFEDNGRAYIDPPKNKKRRLIRRLSPRAIWKSLRKR